MTTKGKTEQFKTGLSVDVNHAQSNNHFSPALSCGYSGAKQQRGANEQRDGCACVCVLWGGWSQASCSRWCQWVTWGNFRKANTRAGFSNPTASTHICWETPLAVLHLHPKESEKQLQNKPVAHFLYFSEYIAFYLLMCLFFLKSLFGTQILLQAAIDGMED